MNTSLWIALNEYKISSQEQQQASMYKFFVF